MDSRGRLSHMRLSQRSHIDIHHFYYRKQKTENRKRYMEHLMADLARLHVVIEGRVQGVFFRAATRDEARARGLAGWVRNLADGRGEGLFEGDKRVLEGRLGGGHQ